MSSWIIDECSGSRSRMLMCFRPFQHLVVTFAGQRIREECCGLVGVEFVVSLHTPLIVQVPRRTFLLPKVNARRRRPSFLLSSVVGETGLSLPDRGLLDWELTDE